MKISKIKQIKKIKYNGKKVYDLSFDKDNLFFSSSKDLDECDNLLNFSILIHNSSPDIDIDYQSNTDNITNEFLINKYGKERVLPVATFLTFNEKACLKDVVRAHRGPEETGYDSDVFRVTEEMPNWLKVDYRLNWWFDEWPNDKNCSPVVKSWLKNPENKEILQQTLKLQGQIRGVGQHAAGVVITPGPSWEYIPTNIIASKKTVVTAFQEADKSGKDLSKLGILKLDMLKLDTLNVIRDTINLIKETKGIDIQDKIDYVDITDINLYTELRLGLNNGIFQFESSGMNALIRGMQVENFEEAVAAAALYRPGPMGIGAHEEYIKNKFNPDKIEYIHPALQPILGRTNGVLIFQEQIMFIANQIAGMSLGDGDMLRRYMDIAGDLLKKQAKGEELTEKELNGDKYKNFQKYWNQFLDGAEKNGYKKGEIDKIKNWLNKYLGYSFNRSHSLSYTYLAMQTLYLKHYYPTEFYACLLNYPKGSKKEEQKRWLASTIAAAMSRGIKIKTPSRKSGWKWTMTGDKEISMGFSGITGMGDIAYKELMQLLKENEKTLDTISMAEFFSLKFSKFNKTSFGAAVKAGVFDDWSKSRDHLIDLKTRKRKKVAENQIALFNLSSSGFESQLQNSKYEETPELQKKKEFIEVCNFDLEKIEKMANIKNQLRERAGRVIESIINFSENDYYFFVVETFKELDSVKGKKYLQMRVGDGISTTTLRAFDKMHNKIYSQLEKGGVYISEFVRNKKGFINFKSNAKFQKVKNNLWDD